MQINKITDQFGACAQISADDMEAIAQQGYKTIVNFRPDLEGGDTQPTSASLEAKAKQLGLGYVYIPVVPNQIKPEQVAAFAEVLSQQAKPILGFCRTGNRATNMFQQASASGCACDTSNSACKMIAWLKSKCLITRLIRYLKNK